jgi:hypothetical protein
MVLQVKPEGKDSARLLPFQLTQPFSGKRAHSFDYFLAGPEIQLPIRRFAFQLRISKLHFTISCRDKLGIKVIDQ